MKEPDVLSIRCCYCGRFLSKESLLTDAVSSTETPVWHTFNGDDVEFIRDYFHVECAKKQAEKDAIQEFKSEKATGYLR